MTPGIYLLAASLAGNAALGWAYLGQRDEAATVALERDAARSHASACSDATDALRELADRRQLKASAARAAAANAARTLDAGWSMLKTMLEYKSHQAGIVFEEVNESYSTQTCSQCASIEGPKGLKGLGIRQWTCSCAAEHDRDVNAARNIAARGHARLAGGIPVL